MKKANESVSTQDEKWKLPEVDDNFGYKEEEDNSIEIVPGMTVEEMKAIFFDVSRMVQVPYRIYQLNSAGHRYYYTFDENSNPRFYPSVTTILGQTLPKGRALTAYMHRVGLEEAERYRDERASYGTFMHAEYQGLFMNLKYDFSTLKERFKKYIRDNNLPDNFIYYADEIKKDIMSAAQFIIDYDVKPIAVEIALVHPVFGYAGMIDFVGDMKRSKNSKERIRAQIDFKSGKKGFYDEHAIQLHMYKQMWEENFPQYPIERVYNFAPNNWRKLPTYNLVDQTNNVNAKKIPALIALGAIEDGKKDNVFTSISGEIDLNKSKDLTPNIISLTLAELIKKKAPKGKDLIRTKPKASEGKKPAPPTKVVKPVVKIVKRSAAKPTKPVATKDKQKEKEVLKEPKTSENEAIKNLLTDDTF